MDVEKQKKMKKGLFVAMGIFALLAPLGFDLLSPNSKSTLGPAQTYMFNGGILACLIPIGYFKGSRILNWLCFILWWTFWGTMGTVLLYTFRGYTIEWAVLAGNIVVHTIALFLIGLVLGGFFWTFCDE